MCKDEQRDETRRLTPEEWQGTADFLIGLAGAIEHQIAGETAYTAEERESAACCVRRMLENAAAACIYVADFAADGVTFSVREAEKNEADD